MTIRACEFKVKVRIQAIIIDIFILSGRLYKINKTEILGFAKVVKEIK